MNCKTKISLLRHIAACKLALCITLVEMHLTLDTGDAEIHIPNYVVIHSSRKERIHGGVVFYA